ncbi:radical SAM protein, partial [Candidatus Margulisiibacteriota bacterium]
MIQKRNLKRLVLKAIRQPDYAVKVFLKRAKAFYYYNYGNGAAANPEAITLFLTHRCNLRCKMCGQWGESGVTKQLLGDEIKKDLELNDLKKVIDQVSSFKPNITLFGGEPLVYPGCIDLIKYIKEKNLHCLMVTNGALVERMAEELVASGLDELNLSLDGGKELHDEIRGLPGLYGKIMNGLKQIKNVKLKIKNARPLINLNCTITKYNYDKLEQLLAVAKEAGADSLTFHNLIFLEKETYAKQEEIDQLLSCSSESWQGFIYDPGIDPGKLFANIEKIRQAKEDFSIDFYPNLSLAEMREYYNNKNYIPKEYNARCLSPWIVAYVFPDGNIKPCLNTTFTFGNVKKQEFSQ